MELLQLQYFCEVAKCENITHAAESLMISQPALSKSIKMLESEVGVQLFDRIGKYVVLNDCGKFFYKKISAYLGSLHETIQEVNDMANHNAGTISLIIRAGYFYFKDFYDTFTLQYPQIKLDVANFSVQERRPTSDFDFGITASNFVSPYTNAIPLLREELVVIAPFAHPLADKDTIDMRELEPYEVIGLWKGANIGNYFFNTCHAAGFMPHIIAECQTVDEAIERVCAGQGVSYMPHASLKYLYEGRVKVLHVRDPGSYRIIKLTWSKNRYLTNSNKNLY